MVVEMAAVPVMDADLGDIAKFLALSFGGSELHYRQLFSYWWESNSSWHGGLPKEVKEAGWKPSFPQVHNTWPVNDMTNKKNNENRKKSQESFLSSMLPKNIKD